MSARPLPKLIRARIVATQSPVFNALAAPSLEARVGAFEAQVDEIAYGSRRILLMVAKIGGDQAKPQRAPPAMSTQYLEPINLSAKSGSVFALLPGDITKKLCRGAAVRSIRYGASRASRTPVSGWEKLSLRGI
jgi:hypothetical protein